jgi:tRNA A-37 threonylcarbamoyl transferase component Bud32
MSMNPDLIRDLLKPIVGTVVSLEEAEGGLFNRVFKGASADGAFYCKQFSAQAKSGMFPPLPTSPGQRYLVAWHCQEHAYRCSQTLAQTARIPEVIGKDDEHHVVVMAVVEGEPLYDRLQGANGDARNLLETFCRIAAWLGMFHGQHASCLEAVREASAAFKQFKVELQYGDLMEFIPVQARSGAMAFADDYLRCVDTLVHGDLNSRNILVDGETIAIIDFEQGHAGEGVYDLAYIASELVLKWLALEWNPEEAADRMWSAYREAGLRHDPHRAPGAEQQVHFEKHLAFQVAYRILGPSRAIWSANISEPVRQRSLAWAREMLVRLFP